MESKAYVNPFSSSSSSLLSGSLPIRAPLTPDSDSDSDSESNCHDYLGYSISSGNISSFGTCESGGSAESEAFITGEESETASERPFVAEPDAEEQALQPSGGSLGERFELSCPDSGEFDFDPVVEKVMVGDLSSQRVMRRPIAQLSWEDSDGDNDVVGSEEVFNEAEDGDFSSVQINVPPGNNWFVEKLSIAPRVRIFEVEEEEKESEKWKECMEVEGVDSVEGAVSDLNNSVKGRNLGDSVKVKGMVDNGLAIAETNEENCVELSMNVVEGQNKAEYVAEESFVHCPNSKRNGVDLGVTGSENQIVGSSLTICSLQNPIQGTSYLENCDVSELTEDDVEFENALCSDLLKSITLSSLSVTLLCENVAGNNAGAVQFQGDTAAYGAKVDVPLKEKDFLIQQEQTRLGLSGEKISITRGVMGLEEGEEYRSGLWKESLVSEDSEPAIGVSYVEGSDLNNFLEGQKGDSLQPERIEDNGLAAAQINEPNSVELNITVCEGGENVAEESVVHLANRKRDGVDARASLVAIERGISLRTDFGVEGNENQISDSATCSQPNPVEENVYSGTGDLSEATKFDRLEYALCENFLKLITPSPSVKHKHIRGEAEVKNFKINGTEAGVTVMLVGEDVVAGLKIDDQMAIGKRLVLAGSAGALQFEGDSAHGAKFEIRLKDTDFPNRQDQSSLGLSLMKWGGGLVLTTDILSLLSVGSSKLAVHVVLDNKQRGKIAIGTSSSDKFQSTLVSILSIAVSIFGIFRPRFGVQNSRQ